MPITGGEERDECEAGIYGMLSLTRIPSSVSSYRSLNSVLPVGLVLDIVPGFDHITDEGVFKPITAQQYKDIIRCRKCQAFISTYCTLTPDYWQCCICNHMNPDVESLASTVPFPVGKSSNYQLIHKEGFKRDRDPSSVSTAYELADTAPMTVIMVDSTLPPSDLVSIASYLEESLATLPTNTMMALIAFGAHVTIYEVGNASMCAGIVYNGSTAPSAGSLDRLGKHEGGERGQVKMKGGHHVAPLHACKDSILQAITALADCGSREGLGTSGASSHERSGSSSSTKSRRNGSGSSSRNSDSIKPAQRCFGTAMKYAVHILDIYKESNASYHNEMDPHLVGTSDGKYNIHGGTLGGRILCLLHGAPNTGPGAVMAPSLASFATLDETLLSAASVFYKSVGEEAYQKRIGIDIMTASYQQLGTMALTKMLEATMGSFSVQVDGWADESLRSTLSNYFKVGYCRGGSIEVITSPSVKVSKIVGGIHSLYVTTHHRGGGSSVGESVVGHIGRMSLPFGVAIYFDLTADLDTTVTGVAIQVVVRSIDADSHIVTNVRNHMITIDDDLNSCVNSVNESACFVLLAKNMIETSRKGRGTFSGLSHHKAGNAVADLVRTINSKFGSSTGVFSRVYLPPPLLQTLPRLLYNTQRSGILGGKVSRSEDAIEPLRVKLMGSAHGHFVKSLSPSLYMAQTDSGPTAARTAVEWRQVPLETLALQSTAVLYCDAGEYIYIWSGSSRIGEEFDYVRESAVSLAKDSRRSRWTDLLEDAVGGKMMSLGRELCDDLFTFMEPTVHLLQEGQSMERRFTSLLSPSHRDGHLAQISNFPQLETISPDDLAHLRRKLLVVDDVSYQEFIDGLFG